MAIDLPARLPLKAPLPPSVSFAQPERKPLNRMQFCTASPGCGRLAGGGNACERERVGLANHEYRTRDVGGVWGVRAAARSAGSVATGADRPEDTRVGPA